jgi:hypothetical protein
MSGDEDSDDRPPPRPSIPRRRREGIVIEATISRPRRWPRWLGLAALAAILLLAGAYWARAALRPFVATRGPFPAARAGLAQSHKVGETPAAFAQRGDEAQARPPAARSGDARR